PLIYPSTNSPVLCQPGKRGCPVGFGCVQSSTTNNHICCPSRHADRPGYPGDFGLGAYYSRGGPPAAINPCEGYMVLVTRVVNGRVEKRCERSCPFPQIPIGGVCYELKKNKTT
uniref:Uncharacterized protein n=1 Tax=Caenorhabditis japonica TaxID=281687 RepID=A0A8R1J2E1_CAEJA